MAIGGFIPTARYLAQLQGGAVTNVITNIAVTSGGEPVAGYDDIPITTMTVTANRSSAQRTTVSMTVPITQGTWWPVPTDLSSPLSPNGNELLITAGYQYSDGSQDNFQQGIFPIVSCAMTAQGNLTMVVTADDRSYSFSSRGILAPFTVTEDDNGDSTATISETIYTPGAGNSLLTCNNSALPPGITFNIAATDQLAPPNTYSVGQDPWEASLDLATSTGWSGYADPFGNMTFAPPPLTGNPIWQMSSLPGDMIVTIGSRTLTADQVFNDYFVITANSDSYDYDSVSPTLLPPIQVEISDDNPTSPTYINGNFGDRPQFIQSSVSTNSQAADAEATLDLALSLGQIDTLQFTGPINPAVQIDDFVNVYCPRIGLRSYTLFVVDGFTTTYALNGTTQYSLRRVITL